MEISDGFGLGNGDSGGRRFDPADIADSVSEKVVRRAGRAEDTPQYGSSFGRIGVRAGDIVHDLHHVGIRRACGQEPADGRGFGEHFADIDMDLFLDIVVSRGHSRRLDRCEVQREVCGAGSLRFAVPVRGIVRERPTRLVVAPRVA